MYICNIQNIQKADLVTESMSANGDGLCPARNKSGNVLADDWLTEDGAAQNVPDGSVGTLPHFLQFELCQVLLTTKIYIMHFL